MLSSPASTASFALWRLFPALLGLLVSPLAFGSVTSEGQALIGLCFGATMVLLADQPLARTSRPSAWVVILAAMVLLLPLLPLPIRLLALIDPERAAWASRFPIEIGTTPIWATISLSPATTVRRVWEIGLAFAAFAAARSAAQHPTGPRAVILTVATGVLALAASDYWYRQDGQRLILNVWSVSWGKGAGTFANRNHFACWIYTGTLFCLGWVLRSLSPLRSVRPRETVLPPVHSIDVVFILAALAAGVAMAVRSGSRGGIISLALGMTVWLALLARRSRDQSRSIALAVLFLVMLGAALIYGTHLLERLSLLDREVGANGKVEVWRQAAGLLAKFPVFGIGLGAFPRAMSQVKVGFSKNSVLFVENEYLQWLVETGLPGLVLALVFVVWLWRRAIRPAWAAELAEPEIMFGSAAALLAWAFHASFEFLFQIPATAILASTVLGLASGLHDYTGQPAVRPPPSRRRIVANLALAAILIAAASLQWFAFVSWWRASRPGRTAAARVNDIRESQSQWPFATQRRIGFARLAVDALPSSDPARLPGEILAIRTELNRALRLDPFHWELRLERAWLDLAFSPDRDRAMAEANEVTRLNPMQSRIPLRFASALMNQDPASTRTFLNLAAANPDSLPEAYEIAWKTFNDSASLWSLTPNTPAGLSALADFALRQRLAPLAAEASMLLTNWFAPTAVAARLLEIPRADLALRLLPANPTQGQELKLALRAHWLARDYDSVIRLAEPCWLASSRRVEIFTPVEPDGALALQPTDSIHTSTQARAAAEALCAPPPARRDPHALRRLGNKFPAEPRIQWLIYQTESALDHPEQAAEAALRLANLVLEKQP